MISQLLKMIRFVQATRNFRPEFPQLPPLTPKKCLKNRREFSFDPARIALGQENHEIRALPKIPFRIVL